VAGADGARLLSGSEGSALTTLRRPLAFYLLLDSSLVLLFCLWGSLNPITRWRSPSNALLNVFFGVYILEVLTVLPSALGASLILLPWFMNDRIERLRSQTIALTTVGLFLQAVLIFLIESGAFGDLGP
jgi:hypothetical protein